jgi:hypothetical protein
MDLNSNASWLERQELIATNKLNSQTAKSVGAYSCGYESNLFYKRHDHAGLSVAENLIRFNPTFGSETFTLIDWLHHLLFDCKFLPSFGHNSNSAGGTSGRNVDQRLMR